LAELDPQSSFDAYYFAHCCGEPYQRSDVWLALFDGFANRILQDISPKSVLDAGCAMGFLVEFLRQRGIDAWGVDISQYAILQVNPEMKPYCWQGSIIDPFPRKYELIVTIEVLEHMPKEDAEVAISNLCNHSDDILFSSTPFDYKEVTHKNVQPPEYWAEIFARQGFYRDVDFDASFITPWAVRFRKRKDPAHRIIRDYERRFWTLWKENTDLRSLANEMREQLVDQEANSKKSTPDENLQPRVGKASQEGKKNPLDILRGRVSRFSISEEI
jgi:SAM-dependent methyltransferase